jgi:hypothetical protein
LIDLEQFFGSQLSKLRTDNDYLKDELEATETECRSFDQCVVLIRGKIQEKTIECQGLLEDCKFEGFRKLHLKAVKCYCVQLSCRL